MEYTKITIIDKNTGKKNLLDNFSFFQHNPDCVCKRDMAIQSFNFNGQKVNLPAPFSAPYIITINKN
jgi:hypothetical protein